MGKSLKPRDITYIGIDEEWRWVYLNNEQTKYQVSNLGQVRNTERKNKLLETILDRYGYVQICLCHRGIHYIRTMHTLVARAFIPNPDNKPQVNHKNGDKEINAVYNLEWATSKENMIHAYKNHLHDNTAKGINHGLNVYSPESIREVCRLIQSNEYTLPEISKMTKVSHSTVVDVFKRKYWIDISKNYNFDNFNKFRRADMPKDIHDLILKMASEGSTTREICEATGIRSSDKNKYANIRHHVLKYKHK